MIYYRFVIFLAMFLMICGMPCRGALHRFSNESVNGRNYVTLQDFINYYGFNGKLLKKQKLIVLKKKYATLQLRIDSREAFLNKDNQEIRLWMNFAPIQSEHSVLIPEIDVIKTFDPVLRPWAVPETRVKTILIDPGHGGIDNGTLGVSRGVMEKIYALDTAKRVEQILKLAGYKTLLTRRQDEYVSLEDRADQANVISADLFISIHYNSAKPDRGPNGFETYCLTPAGASSTGNENIRMSDYRLNPGNGNDTQNMLLAFCIQHSLVKNIPETNDRGIKRARFVVIKETKRPAILVECGFLSNPAEENRIRTPAYRQKIAEALCGGIQKFISYINPKKASANSMKLRVD